VTAWTRATVYAWAVRNLPQPFQSCHVGDACERTLGFWSNMCGVMAALKKFDLVIAYNGKLSIPHAVRSSTGRACRGKRGSHAWVLVHHDDLVERRAQRLRDACDVGDYGSERECDEGSRQAPLES
jgi:hypothetical protein